MTPPRTVDAVVVSYNVRELLLDCISALEREQLEGEIASIFVVDHKSSDGSVSAVRCRFPDVEILEEPNLGYGAGMNMGVRQSNAAYVLALNADTVVTPGAVRELADFLDRNPSIGIAGPRLIYPDGTEQPSRRRFPRRLTPIFESTPIHRRWPSNRWARNFHMLDQPAAKAETVDWVVGACLMIRRSALDRCGGFDTSFRMYSEEVELAWRFRKHGWRTAWVANATVNHRESASASQNVGRRQINFDRSRVELTRKLYGRPMSELVRSALLAGYLFELSIEFSKYLAGNRKDLRRRRIGVYGAALFSGLRGEQQ